MLGLFNLKLLINTPTRITPNSSTIIDHILCNSSENVIQSGTIPVGLSDNLLTYVTRKASRGVFNSHNTIRIRSLKNYSENDFLQQLANADWSICFNVECVNSA